MKLIFAFVFLFSLLAAVETYSVGQTCSVNTDCDSTSTDVYCQFVPTMNPACTKGICACKSGYVFVTDKCVATTSKSLNATCNTTAGNEIYPYGAGCSATLVKCSEPDFYESGGVCLRYAMAAYNATCEVSPSLKNLTCNSSVAMTCDSSTLRCACNSNHYYQSSSASCVLRTYGDSCSTTAECDTGRYTQSAGGGANCTSSTCGCSTGYTKVDRLGYLSGDTSTSTISICIKNHTANVASANECTLMPENEANNGAKVCSSSLLCSRCPESTAAATLGKCRSFVSATDSSSGQKRVQFGLLSSFITLFTFAFL